MIEHKFGIMSKNPAKGEKYELYEPEKYLCIAVDDEYILPVLKKFNDIKCYWNTLDRAEKGLAYYGITLIPPESLGIVIKIIQNNHDLSELLDLFSKAKSENKFIIHFGI